jgi:hypothetical protein
MYLCVHSPILQLPRLILATGQAFAGTRDCSGSAHAREDVLLDGDPPVIATRLRHRQPMVLGSFMPLLFRRRNVSNVNALVYAFFGGICGLVVWDSSGITYTSSILWTRVFLLSTFLK